MRRLPGAFLLLLLIAPARADAPMVPNPTTWMSDRPLDSAVYDALDTALAAQFMTREDLSFKKDYLDDPWRFDTISHVLDEPLSGYDITWQYGHVLDVDDVPAQLIGSEGWAFLTDQLDLPDVPVRMMKIGVEQLPVVLAGQFDTLREAHNTLFGPVWEADAVAAHLPLIELVTESESTSPYPEGTLTTEALALWDRSRALDGGVAYAQYLQEALRLAALTQHYAATLETISARPSPFETTLVETLQANGWIVIVGTAGDDHHDVYQGHVVLDLSGNDTYTFHEVEPFATPLGHWVLDLSGDDIYRGASPGAAGGAYGATSLLLDLHGDDVYRTGALSQGAALYGVGMRLDRGGGRDLYDGGDFTQGAAMFGLGLSFDDGGDDSYNAAIYGQAAAMTGGLALCLDRGGDDRYFAGGVHPDYPRWPEHYLSLSQGFAIGLRPTASGGIAFLGDYAGNDVYAAEVYGQGVGYWYSLGMLLDRSGHDWYQCLQYGQGAGIHLAAGCLIDVAGIDHYNGWANLQGNGHDLGVGLFLEVSGRDYMTSNDLSQGAGNANGLGIAIDLAGDDAWLVRNPDNNQGYGNPRRDFGSIGILIDMLGKDQYSIPGHADGLMWTGSRWGVGYDLDAPAELAPVKFIQVSGTSGATR